MIYSGDTVLCGQTWNNFKVLPLLNANVMIRTEMGKYYLLGNCTDQKLFYDFSKNTGDTVFTDYGARKVIETGLFTLTNGEQRKKMLVRL